MHVASDMYTISGNPLQKISIASVASTRSNSPGGSSITSGEADCSTPTHEQDQLGVIAQRRGLRAAILTDLGVDLEGNVTSTPTSAAASPVYLQRRQMVVTPSSAVGASPSGIISTRPTLCATPNTPVVGDASRRSPAGGCASQRSPMLASTGFGDASRRSPMMSSPGLPRGLPPRAPQCLGTSPPKPAAFGDASQRSPAARPSPVGVASWGAAAASIAATRDAAVAVPCSIPPPPAHSAEAAPCVPRASSPQNQVSSTAAGGVTLHVTDSVKCWLSGTSGKDMPSAEELLARLRAAQPECYDD